MTIVSLFANQKDLIISLYITYSFRNVYVLSYNVHTMQMMGQLERTRLLFVSLNSLMLHHTVTIQKIRNRYLKATHQGDRFFVVALQSKGQI